MRSRKAFFTALALTVTLLNGCASPFNPDGSLNKSKLNLLRYGVLIDWNTGKFDLTMKTPYNETAKLYMNIVNACGLGMTIKDGVVYPAIHDYIMSDGIIDRDEIYIVDNYNKCTKGYINTDYIKGIYI